MAGLSISRAWDESKAQLAHDGRLFTTVAFALIAFPRLVITVLSPGAAPVDEFRAIDILLIGLALVTLIGQLAIARLAFRPAVTVGEAINRGVRRFPTQLAIIVLFVLVAFLAFAPFFVAAASDGVDLTRKLKPEDLSGKSLLAIWVAIIALVYVCLRMIPLNAVVVAENLGPVASVVRSWKLTSGSAWRLFLFFVMMVVALMVVMIAVSMTVGAVAVAVFGPLEPMSATALVLGLVDGVVTSGIVTLFVVMTARIYAQLAGRDTVEPLS